MKRKYKEIYNRVEKDRLDSMFYRMSDDEPLRKVSYKGRTWGIWPYGEVKLTYNESRYYCCNEYVVHRYRVLLLSHHQF